MLDVAAACLDCGLRAPRQGDSDEGRALMIASPESNRWEALLALGQALVGAPEWWPPAQPGVASTLLPALARRRTLPGRPASRPWHFDDAGITIFRSEPTWGPEIWCRCDSGPHGFLSIAAHAHADALSVEVRHDGTDILTDPGTYCYHGEPMWREWIRSTAAHNTVEIGGESQAESGGPFLWITQPRTRTRTCNVGDQSVQTWTADHDGYLRLPIPTVHRRSV